MAYDLRGEDLLHVRSTLREAATDFDNFGVLLFYTGADNQRNEENLGLALDARNTGRAWIKIANTIRDVARFPTAYDGVPYCYPIYAWKAWRAGKDARGAREHHFPYFNRLTLLFNDTERLINYIRRAEDFNTRELPSSFRLRKIEDWIAENDVHKPYTRTFASLSDDYICSVIGGYERAAGHPATLATEQLPKDAFTLCVPLPVHFEHTAPHNGQ